MDKAKTLKIEDNGQYYGVVGKNNTIVVPFEYDEIIRTFSSGLINVCKNDKWGCLDLNGNIVIPLKYDWISPFGRDNTSTSCARRDGKWGVLDRNGNEIIPFVYDEEIAFKHDVAIVTMNGKKGLIDKAGRIVIPCQYSFLKPFVNSPHYFKFIENDKFGIIDLNGNIVVPPTFYKEESLTIPDKIEQKDGVRKESVGVTRISEYEVIRILKKEYEMVESFHPHHGIYIVGKTNKMGVIKFHDNIPEVIVPIEYDTVNMLFKNAYLLVAIKSGRYRIIKITKNIIALSPFYDQIGQYVSYYGLVQVRNGNYVGAVNSMAKEVIPVQYDLLDNCAFHAISADKLVMKKDGKWGVLNNTGEVLLPFEYDEIDYDGIFHRTPEYKIKNQMIIVTPSNFTNTSLLPVMRNNKWGLVDFKLKAVVPCIYTAIRQDTINKLKLIKKKGHDVLLMTKDGPLITYLSTVKLDCYQKVGEFEYGYAVVERDGKYGYIDEEYNEVVSCVFDEVFPFEDNIAVVRKLGKYGCVDKGGHEIVPCVYDQSIEFNRGVAIVEKDGMMGAINKKGEIIVPIVYPFLADLSMIGPTLLMAVKERLLGVIDKNNKVVVPFEYNEVLPMFGMITVTKHGKKGVFNHKGQLIVPVEFDEIQHPSMEATSINVCKNGKWGVLNKSGQEICEPRYDKIDDYGFACGRLAVCREDKWGFINKQGREVIECIYDEVFQFFEENHCEVMLNGKKMTIDLYGNRNDNRIDDY